MADFCHFLMIFFMELYKGVGRRGAGGGMGGGKSLNKEARGHK